MLVFNYCFCIALQFLEGPFDHHLFRLQNPKVTNFNSVNAFLKQNGWNVIFKCTWNIPQILLKIVFFLKTRISVFLQLYCINSACMYNVSVKSKLQHRPPTPGHIPGIWHLCRPREEGWGIWTVPSISCEISGRFPLHVVSYHGGRSVRGFSWKRLCLCGQLVARKEWNELCAIFEGI